jgi:hypothetical protein
VVTINSAFQTEGYMDVQQVALQLPSPGEGNASLVKAFLQLCEEGQERLVKQEKTLGFKKDYKYLRNMLYQGLDESAERYLHDMQLDSTKKKLWKENQDRRDKEAMDKFVAQCKGVRDNAASNYEKESNRILLEENGNGISESCIIRVSSSLQFFWCRTSAGAECGMALKSAATPSTNHQQTAGQGGQVPRRREYLDIGDCRTFLHKGMENLMDHCNWMKSMNQWVPLLLEEYLTGQDDRDYQPSRHSNATYQKWRGSYASSKRMVMELKNMYIMSTHYVTRQFESPKEEEDEGEEEEEDEGEEEEERGEEEDGGEGDDQRRKEATMMIPEKVGLYDPSQAEETVYYERKLADYESMKVQREGVNAHLQTAKKELSQLNTLQEKDKYRERAAKNKEIDYLKDILFQWDWTIAMESQILRTMKNIIDSRV